MKVCTKCGKSQEDTVDFCTNCGEKFLEKQESELLPRKRSITKNKFIVIAVILILVLSVTLFSIYVYEEEKLKTEQNRYNTLENEYTDLENSFDSLQTQNSNLATRYNTLSNQYNELNRNYNALNQLTSQYNELPIDHLMELMNNQIREQCQPNYILWFGEYYYDKSSVDYAATVCAHDLGRVYWPSVENDYYQITGTQLCNTAYDKIITLIDIIGITKYDSNSVKIEKILGYISSHITYQSDLNNEFLFPSETMTFRSGDCDDFSILAAALFEDVGIESAIGFFVNTTYNTKHSMVLVHLSDLGTYGYSYYDDLTNLGLSPGKWIVLEPQVVISQQYNQNTINKWSLIVAAEILNQYP